jgi:hypothetical protein
MHSAGSAAAHTVDSVYVLKRTRASAVGQLCNTWPVADSRVCGFCGAVCMCVVDAGAALLHHAGALPAHVTAAQHQPRTNSSSSSNRRQAGLGALCKPIKQL